MAKTAKRKSSSKKATHKKKEKPLSLSDKVEVLRVKYLALLESHNHNAVVINTLVSILEKKGVIDKEKDLPRPAVAGAAQDLRS